MPDIKRTVKLVTEQHVLPDTPSGVEGYPMREWSIKIFIVGPDGEELPANCFDKVTYKLHESFGPRAKQVVKGAPFRISEQGWGEFDMQIVLTPFAQPKGEQNIFHDLNFQSERYEALHPFTFRNPKPELLDRLSASGPVSEPATNGGSSAAVATKAATGGEKRKKTNKTQVDMEKLAEGLERLGEDDLLHVVQLVHDNKSDDTYTKNDVENGEFHVDLYTLPDSLIKMLWDFVGTKVNMQELS